MATSQQKARALRLGLFFILQILFLESLNPVFIIRSNLALFLGAAIPFLILQFVLF